MEKMDQIDAAYFNGYSHLKIHEVYVTLMLCGDIGICDGFIPYQVF